MRYYFPYCGREIKPEEETEYGVFCCKRDFWLSECRKEEE
jgi:hypothetical protein